MTLLQVDGTGDAGEGFRLSLEGDRLEADVWSSDFPSNYPTELKWSVKIGALKRYVEHCWNSWTLPQKQTAEKLLKTLEGRTPAPLKFNLPALVEKNAPSAVENGEFMTDVLATWI